MKSQSEAQRHTEIFLVLQGEQAFWFKYDDGRCVDSFVDRMEKDMPDKPSRCPWLSEAPSQKIIEVSLVLNTVLDELDHVAMERRGSSLANYVRRRWCVRQLRKDYAQATVYPVAENRTSHVASLVHHIIPESWSRWLVKLQELNVLVVAVATATELFCQWSDGRNYPVLMDMPVGRERRHLLVSGGTPLFMRMVAISDAQKRMEENDQAVAQTLALVQGSPVSFDTPVGVGQLIVEESSPSEEWSDARLLAALMAGGEVSFRNLAYSGAGRTVGVSTESNSATIPIRSARWQKALRTISARLPRSCKSGERARLWTPLRYAWFSNHALDISVRRLKTLLRIGQLKLVTIAFCVLAVLLIAVASAYGVSGLVHREALRAEQQRHEAKAGHLIQRARSMHAAPVSVARSMLLIDDFNAETILRPALVASIVATALSSSPAVSLERLAWTILNDSEHYDDVVNSTRPAMVRELYWGNDLSSQVVLVEVSGFVSGQNLSDQKRSLDLFVSQLETERLVSHVAVLESPVDSALHSELASELSSAYRISIKLVAV